MKGVVTLSRRFQQHARPRLDSVLSLSASVSQKRFASKSWKPVTTRKISLPSEYNFSHVVCVSASNHSLNVRSCEVAIEYVFKNKMLCFEALNFALPAYIRHPDNPSFYRVLRNSNFLAILGDRLIDSKIAMAWYKRSTVRYTPSAMAHWQKLRTDVPSNANLRKIAQRLGLEQLVFKPLFGDIAVTDKLPPTPERIASTTVEALLGAVYLDGGDAELEALMNRLGLFDLPLLRPITSLDWERAFLHDIEGANEGTEVAHSAPIEEAEDEEDEVTERLGAPVSETPVDDAEAAKEREDEWRNYEDIISGENVINVDEGRITPNRDDDMEEKPVGGSSAEETVSDHPSREDSAAEEEATGPVDKVPDDGSLNPGEARQTQTQDEDLQQEGVSQKETVPTSLNVPADSREESPAAQPMRTRKEDPARDREARQSSEPISKRMKDLFRF